MDKATDGGNDKKAPPTETLSRRASLPEKLPTGAAVVMQAKTPADSRHRS
jgi:hypothetical protein